MFYINSLKNLELFKLLRSTIANYLCLDIKFINIFGLYMNVFLKKAIQFTKATKLRVSLAQLNPISKLLIKSYNLELYIVYNV